MTESRRLYGDQAIAIVGMSGAYPGGRDLDAFWDLLRSGRSGVEPVSDDDLAAARISPSVYRDPRYVRACAPIENYDCLDAGFFGISPAEARMTDPQHRQFLQHCYLALEQAGYMAARGDLSVAVFGGIGVPSYMIELALRGAERTAATTIMPIVVATDKDYVATAVAYRLDLHGPAMTIQTACSTSLVAVHVAAQSLLAHECDLALAGGASVRVPHRAGYMFQDGGIMSRDGYCRPFEESATGTIFGSGVGVVALRRLDDALAAGDPIRAVMLGSAVNNDGARKVGYVAPSVDGQVAVISEALAMAGIDPDQIDYVEAHGTATRIGDAIEATGLSQVFSSRTRRTDACFVGSVKSNIGHVEAAAGIAALTKTVLALEQNWLPPSLFVERPIDEIRRGNAVEVVAAGRPWPQRGPLRLAGVSSFGVGGTNAHVILAAPPARSAAATDKGWHVARITARAPSSLVSMTRRTAEWLERNRDADPASVAASLDHGRPHFQHRTAIPFRSVGELCTGLTALPQSDDANRPSATRGESKIAFVFGGQGSSLRGIAAALCAESKEVADALEEADALLAPALGVSARDVLVSGLCEPTDPRIVQPITVALHVALFRLWQALGVKASVVLGHSIGEISAAIAAGLVTVESGLRFALARGEAMDRLCAEGAMLAVKTGHDTVGRVLAEAGIQGVAVAAVNSPAATVLAGTPDDISHAGAALAAARIATIVLPVSRAYHSALVEPALEAIGTASRLLRSGAGSDTVLVSTLTGKPIGSAEILKPSHWQAHARRSVLFEPALRCALGDGGTHVVEIEAEPKLGVHVRTIAPEIPFWSTQTQRDKGLGPVLKAAGALYAAGFDLDLMPESRSSPRLALPGYAFEPVRYWMEPGGEAEQSGADAQTWTFSIGPKSQPYLADHRVAGRVVIPGTLHIELAMAVAREILGASASLADVVFHRPLSVGDDDDVEVRLAAVRIDASSAHFTIESQVEGSMRRVATGQMLVPDRQDETGDDPVAPTADASIAVDAFYAALATTGLGYGPAFRGIASLRRGPLRASAEIRIPPAVASEMGDYVLHPAVLDACLQVGAAAIKLPAGAPAGYLPVAVRGVRAVRPFDTSHVLTVTAVSRYTTDRGEIVINIHVHDARGLVARVDGLMLAPTGMLAGGRRAGSGLFHRLRWIDSTVGPAQPLPVWLVASADDSQARKLAEFLRERGADVSLSAGGNGGISLNGHGLTHRTVYVGPLPNEASANGPEALWQACAPALDLARDLPRATSSPGFAIVTRGATSPLGEQRNAIQAGLWGCGTAIISERPDLDIRLIDLDPQDDELAIAALADVILSGSIENRIAIRGDRVLVPRLQPFEPAPGERDVAQPVARLETEDPGDLDALSFKSLPSLVPGPSEVLVKVEAAALNFLDVLAALGERPDLPRGPCIFLGSECAGVVEAVGESVDDLAVGDKVVGVTSAAIATHVLANAADMHRYDGLSPGEACALPICYATAEHALCDVARLSAEDTVLIHCATGGVGFAAIEVARHVGARILATAGSEAKRDELRRRGISDVFDSRSSSFVDGVRKATDGRGADVVLNALAGPLLQAGIDSLGKFGRFVDIAKRDIYAGGSIDLEPFRRNLSYSAVDLIQLHRERPERLRALIARVLQQVSTGAYLPLPVTRFPATAVTDAFRYMAAARHIGKIVIDFSHAPEPSSRRVAVFRPDAAYVITGGLGALGLEIAARMVQGGARHLILVGRHAPSEHAASTLGAIRAAGCCVSVLTLDATDAAALKTALAGLATRPVKGVVHAAGVLADAPLENTDQDRFRQVAAPKLGGMQALCSIFDVRTLDFLIAFSSTASIFAPPGQTAYAAANAATEALCESAGGRAISWGAWAGGGMATRSGANALGYVLGLPPMLAADAADAFARFVGSDVGHCAVFAHDPDQIARGARQFGAVAVLRELIGETPADTRSTLLADFERLHTEQDRIDAITALLVGEVAKTLGTGADAVDAEQNFRILGIDSLMALELTKRLERRLGVVLDPSLLALHSTVAELGPAIATMTGLARPIDKQTLPRHPELHPGNTG